MIIFKFLSRRVKALTDTRPENHRNQEFLILAFLYRKCDVSSASLYQVLSKTPAALRETVALSLRHLLSWQEDFETLDFHWKERRPT